jgi:hypothetical protein
LPPFPGPTIFHELLIRVVLLDRMVPPRMVPHGPVPTWRGQWRGAIFTLNADETFMCDLDPMAESDLAKFTPEMVAHAVLGLKEEIRSILLSRRIVH